jgi:K+-sensing histidine kinase KdpD
MQLFRTGPWIAVLAVGGPIAAGGALIALRDRMDNTNIALLLVVVVVAVAAMTGRRAAAAASALSAAAAFNVFHTRPYYSFRIHSSDDIVTAGLLLAVGLAVGELSLRGRLAQSRARQGAEELASLQGLGGLVATGEAVDYVLLATASELTHLLHLVDCRFEREQHDSKVLPTVERDGTIHWGPVVWDSARWGLPTEGAAIPVWARGQRHGRFVLTAPIGLPYDPATLVKALALVDQAGAALAGYTSAA